MKTNKLVLLVAGILSALAAPGFAAPVENPIPPDIIVAADGSGNFTSLFSAVLSIPRDNRDRRVIFVKNGTYRERVRVDAACLTIRGESRASTRLEFPHPASAPIDALGRAVLDLGATANDFVLENMTVENTHGVIGQHAFAILGRADRVVIQDCDILSQGNDTLALWRGWQDASNEVAASMVGDDTALSPDGGRYYHARLRVQGSVDFICPRGWCYLTDSTITQLNPKATAAMWHEGRNIPDKKFVLRNCRFDGPPDWYLARHHHDAHFYFIGCTFAETLRDRAPYRVIYPHSGATPTEADMANNRKYDLSNLYGERAYFHDSHRAGGDYAWHKDNLAQAPSAPRPEQITAKWTFAGKWDPERTDAPVVVAIHLRTDAVELEFSERVTVKGRPQIVPPAGEPVVYKSGSGTKTLSFATRTPTRPTRLDLAGGFIIATEAGTTLRPANLKLP